MQNKRGCSKGCFTFVFVIVALMGIGILFMTGKEHFSTPTAPPSIADTLLSAGYSEEHAAEIKSVLASVGITSIEIHGMSGEAETGLNAMTCYANGSDEHRFTVTTEDGVVFYIGFLDETLYDSSRGGVLKQYSDVHIPEDTVSSGAESTLMMMAEDVAKKIVNYPATVDFKTFEWGFWRNDRTYAVQGTFTCSNAFGVEEEHIIKLVCEASEDYSSISAKEAYLDGVLIKSSD